MQKVSPWALGATLYMPSTRSDLAKAVFGRSVAGLRSLVICLEDAVADQDVEAGIANLQVLLETCEQVGGRPENGPLVFVRPRDAAMAARLARNPLIHHINGFVAPKFNLANLRHWETATEATSLLLMPTLETRDVFDARAMGALCDALSGAMRERILALRIGGNDLLSCLGLRRPRNLTLYDTPVGQVIGMLSGLFGAAGFALTAPVFERLDRMDLLARELELDLAHGLVGKTAIHPTQIEAIHAALRASADDLKAARLILAEDAAAVFRHDDAMCEPATHRAWARNVLARAQCHGVDGDIGPIAAANVVAASFG